MSYARYALFTVPLILMGFYGVGSADLGWYILPFAAGNFLGPLILGLPASEAIGSPVEVQAVPVSLSHQSVPLSVGSITSQSIEPESSIAKMTLGLASTEALRGSSARFVAPEVAL